MTYKKLHILITGPIRPNKDYINYLVESLKSVTFSIFDVKIYLCYWKTPSIDKKDIENVDFLYEITEPDDSYIFENVLERTKQQRSLGSIEHWTPRMYKMLYGIKNIIESVNNIIEEDDIVIRIRSDLHIKNINNEKLLELINNIDNNSYYFCPKKSCGNSCDWFGICKFKIFKKIWYVRSIKEHNNLIKTLYNIEHIVIEKSKLHNIKLYDIKNILELNICRSFNNKNDMKLVSFR